MASSIWEHFSVVPDPRVDRTQLHKLEDILTVTLCAVICNCDTWNEHAPPEKRGMACESRNLLRHSEQRFLDVAKPDSGCSEIILHPISSHCIRRG